MQQKSPKNPGKESKMQSSCVRFGVQVGSYNYKKRAVGLGGTFNALFLALALETAGVGKRA